MPTENEKAIAELNIFNKFVCLSELNIDVNSIEKRLANNREPDIFCFIDSFPYAFELTENCSEQYKTATNNMFKNELDHIFVRGSDSSDKTLKKKLNKQYSINHPVDLLLYSNGMDSLPEDIVVENCIAIIESLGTGQFSRIWFMSSKVILIGKKD